MQPIAAADVSAALVEFTLGKPLNGVAEIAGPRSIGMDAAVRQYLAARGDTRRVITDPQAGYFGVLISDSSLTPGDGAHLCPTSFEEWLGRADQS
jgi:uncharacterized protein YbjT (DUF2867 family)